MLSTPLLILVAATSLVHVAAAAVDEGGDGVPPVSSRIVDLTLPDFAIHPLVDSNPGATMIQELASADPLLRSLVVLQDGHVVANYTREGVSTTDVAPIWSVTKSWTSLLMGLLVQEGLLSLNETLLDIFGDDDPAVWATAADRVSVRQAVTVEKLLTMTSGFQDPPTGDSDKSAATTPAWFDGGTLGGANLSHSLAYPTLGAEKFQYLATSNILSYVLQKRTGMTPREYLQAKVLPHLGIDNNDFRWWQNAEGVEYSYHGLSMTLTQMAKWGQLYLQQGKSNATTQLIDREWITASTTVQATNGLYGYLIWILPGAFVNQPELGTFYFASGLGGQVIAVSPTTGRVVVQQRDLPRPGSAQDDDEEGDMKIAVVALHPDTFFIDTTESVVVPTTTEDADGTVPDSLDGKSGAFSKMGSISSFALLFAMYVALQT